MVEDYGHMLRSRRLITLDYSNSFVHSEQQFILQLILPVALRLRHKFATHCKLGPEVVLVMGHDALQLIINCLYGILDDVGNTFTTAL